MSVRITLNYSRFSFRGPSQYSSNPQLNPSNQHSSGSRFHGNPQAHASQGYQNQQMHNQPRFPNAGNRSSYATRGSHSQHPPPMINQQPQSSYQPQNRQTQNQYQQQFTHGAPSQYSRPPSQNRQLYQPNPHGGANRGKPFNINLESVMNQSAYLEDLLQSVVPGVGIDLEELTEKEAFRSVVEQACKEAIVQYEQEKLSNPLFDVSKVELKCFGSMSSGFATKASDMDLALVTPHSNPTADSPESPIPRILERKLLDMGYGARLLTRTRVPIIKLCQKPTPKLLADLIQERAKWETGFVDEESDKPTKAKSSEESATKTDNIAREDTISSPEITSAEATAREEPLANKLGKLKQKDNQSLGDYYNTAKRLLRQLGSHDVSLTSPDITDDQGATLNAVCGAFISGLKSSDLVARLRTYQSIHPLFDPATPFLQRSLNGVWNQVEGERLAMMWETRPVSESNDQREMECWRVVEAWRCVASLANRRFPLC